MCSGQKEEAEDEMGNVAEGQVKEDLAGFVEFFLLCVLIFLYTRYIRERVMSACAKVPPQACKGLGSEPLFITSSLGGHRRLGATVLGSRKTMKIKQGSVMVRIAFWQDHFGCITWENRKEQDWRLLQSSRHVIMNAQIRGELVWKQQKIDSREIQKLELAGLGI